MSFDPNLFIKRLKKGAALSGQTLTQDQLGLMASHAGELMVWNKKINLTGIKDPMAVAEKHFIDAVCVYPLLNKESRIMDMGTGGGFPALPLKILNPEMAVTMVDAVRKKVNFLNHVVRTLGLDDILAVHARVEDLSKDPSHAQGYDAVISRGFADLEKFVDLALPMLRPGGRIYALKGDHARKEITPALDQAFEISTTHYRLPFEKSERYLVCLIQK